MRLDHCSTVVQPYVISIHAPTWGATVWCSRNVGGLRFQSTHPRGVRHDPVLISAYFNDFNPRTHVGCDVSQGLGASDISNFNPRTHVGCDSSDSPKRRSSRYFNPRTHVGCDINGFYRNEVVSNFNPRTHVGCDCCGPLFFSQLSQFQSTHPRGVRLKHNIMPRSEEISIHAPTWGATVNEFSENRLWKFQSTHPRGVRQENPACGRNTLQFQSTHPRGVRPSNRD